MSRINTTILTSSLGMRHYLPMLFAQEEFAQYVSDFLKAPAPRTLDEAHEEASQFAYLITEGERVSARGIDHFASERWNVRWLEDVISHERILCPGGWSTAVDTLVDAGSGSAGHDRLPHALTAPRQLLLPFWGDEDGRLTGTEGEVSRPPEGNRFILNNMLVMSNGWEFDMLCFESSCFDMRQSANDPDLLLFGVVAREE